MLNNSSTKMETVTHQLMGKKAVFYKKIVKCTKQICETNKGTAFPGQNNPSTNRVRVTMVSTENENGKYSTPYL